DSPQIRGDLAIVLRQRANDIANRQPAEAEQMFLRAADISLTLVNEFPESAVGYEVLGGVLMAWGKWASTFASPQSTERYDGFVKQVSKAFANYAAKSADEPDALKMIATVYGM